MASWRSCERPRGRTRSATGAHDADRSLPHGAERGLRRRGRVQLLDHDGDLHFNGVRIPLRATCASLEQLQQEFHAREIPRPRVRARARSRGVRVVHALLPRDRRVQRAWNCSARCETQGITRVFPAFVTAGRNGGRGILRRAELAQSFATTSRRSASSSRSRRRAIARRQVSSFATSSARCSPWSTTRWRRTRREPVDVRRRTPRLGVTRCRWRSSPSASARSSGLDRATLASDSAPPRCCTTPASPAVAEGVYPVRADERDEAAEARGALYVIEGVRQIAAGALHERSLLAMRVALEHHAYGPSAFPALPADRRSPLSEIVAIADAFNLRFSRGAGTTTRTPSEALATDARTARRRVRSPLCARRSCARWGSTRPARSSGSTTARSRSCSPRRPRLAPDRMADGAEPRKRCRRQASGGTAAGGSPHWPARFRAPNIFGRAVA